MTVCPPRHGLEREYAAKSLQAASRVQYALACGTGQCILEDFSAGEPQVQAKYPLHRTYTEECAWLGGPGRQRTQDRPGTYSKALGLFAPHLQLYEVLAALLPLPGDPATH